MALKDYAISTVVTAPSPATSGTTLTVTTGHGTRFGATPFYATLVPEGQLPTLDTAEKVQVIGISGDTLTIVRAQGDTTAKSVAAGWLVVGAVFQKDISPTEVAVTTAAGTATKVGTTAAGNYSPEYGDRINVAFSSGCNVNNPTLNIDSYGAKNIRLGVTNVSTALLGIAAAVTIPMWYDGTYWQIYGSFHNTNTTYTEISEAEAANTTSSTTRLITGRRLQTAISNAIAAITGFVKSSTTDRLTVSDTAPSSPATGDVWIDTNDLPEELAPTSIVWKETPGGTKDGTNTDFTTSQAYVSGSLQLFKNGVAQSGMVSEDAPGSGQFSITPAPESGDDLSLQYQVRTTATGNADTVDGYHANATPTANNIPVLNSSGKMPIKAANSFVGVYPVTGVSISSTNVETTLATLSGITETGKYKITANVRISSGNSTSITDTVLNVLVNGVSSTGDYDYYSNPASSWSKSQALFHVLDYTAGDGPVTLVMRRNNGTATIAVNGGGQVIVERIG